MTSRGVELRTETCVFNSPTPLFSLRSQGRRLSASQRHTRIAGDSAGPRSRRTLTDRNQRHAHLRRHDMIGSILGAVFQLLGNIFGFVGSILGAIF